MKKIPKKKRKVTELYFNEYDGTAEIYTCNTKLKKASDRLRRHLSRPLSINCGR